MDWYKDENWIHFTGIGGITVGQLAIAYSKRGYRVTGSDGDIFEPMASLLASKPEINIKSGYHHSNLILQTYTGQQQDASVVPALVIAAGGLPNNNRELLFAAKRNIKTANYAQILEEDCIVKNSSIVVAGSYGKTTVTALLVNILNTAGIKISYMVGGIASGVEDGVCLREPDTQYSVVEGDEYISSRQDTQSKFFHYHPRFLVFTGYAYDHTDVFTTPESYYNNYAKLIQSMPDNGIICYNQAVSEVCGLVSDAKCQTIPYNYNQTGYNLEVKLLGDFNKQNALAAYTLAKHLGLEEETVRMAIASFGGVKRRLEIIWEENVENKHVTIVDDFGATPAKSKAALDVLRQEYPESNITAVFEPNLGSRFPQAIPEFANSFTNADQVILPPFTRVSQDGLLDNAEFLRLMTPYATNMRIVNSIEAFAGLSSEYIRKSDREKQVVIFLSSHSVDQYKKVLIQNLHGT